jgi:hypothetical protein
VPARRSAATMEKDQRAYDLFRRGLSYRQIAEQVGYKTPSAAFTAVRRAARDNVMDPVEADTARQVFLDRFQDYRRAAQRILATRHYVTSQKGEIVTGPGPDKLPLIDDEPVLRALDRLCKIDDMELRLRDLWPAARHRVEVIDDDVARMLADEAEREIARLAADDPDHRLTGEPGPPR